MGLHNNSQPSTDINWKLLKTLVVDVQCSASMIVQTMLNNFGTKKVDIAINNKETINLCKKNHYDLLFIGSHLNGNINGDELTKQLREKKLISVDCGVIMISGDSSVEVVLAMMDAYIDSFIAKPITKVELQKKVSEVYADIKAMVEISMPI